jgi:hypothetical protein
MSQTPLARPIHIQIYFNRVGDADVGRRPLGVVSDGRRGREALAARNLGRRPLGVVSDGRRGREALVVRNVGRRPLGVRSPTIRRREGPL